MIIKVIDQSSISITPEESDDLLILRRVIVKGDRLVGNTTRVIKQERDYSRPDRGERIHIRIAINVEKISLDHVLDKLKVRGTILESSSKHVPHGSYHSFIVKPNQWFTLTKRRWSKEHKDLLKSNKKQFGFLLVAIDKNDCGIGRLKGTRLQIVPNIYSDYSGKRYKSTFDVKQFFNQIKNMILNYIKENDIIIIFGPGETRKKFANYLDDCAISKKHHIKIVEGIDSGGEDGLYIFTKSNAMKKVISESKLAKVSEMIDQVMFMAHKKSTKFTMGFKETKMANECGAIDSLVFSEKIFQIEDEEAVIEFLNNAEKNGVKIYSVDSSTDLGLRVTSLGGIISILRFSIKL